MKRKAVLRLSIQRLTLLSLPICLLVWLLTDGAASMRAASEPPETARRPSELEARDRARLLHETVHATLHYVHQDYYREDEGLPIPAASLQQVFRALAERQGVTLHWLAVNARAMNVDHKPRNSFEISAVRALSGGQEEVDAVEQGVYRHAGVIPLGSECMTCHLPGQTRAAKRVAALVIELPVDSSDAPKDRKH